MQLLNIPRRFPCGVWFYVLGLNLVMALLFSSGAATYAVVGNVIPHFVTVSPFHRYLGRVDGPLAYNCKSSEVNKYCYGVDQVRTAYSIAPLLANGFTGKGRTIVIIDAYQAPHLRDDVGDFDARFGLPPLSLQIIAPDTLPAWDSHDTTQQTWAAEISLDVEWAHAMAPDASITLVESKSENDPDLIRVLNYTIDHDLGDVISMSFGESEDCATADVLKAWHEAFEKATRSGITLLSSSGDSGTGEPTCDNKSWNEAASIPVSDPLVTGVGGTTLNADVKMGTYQSETVWSDPAVRSASGGGFSAVYQKPAYQDHITAIGEKRGVPDVAYNSSTNHGVVVVWSDGDHGPGGMYSFGGTSAGTPQWAAIVAIADQYANQRLGFINPLLYQIGSTPVWYQSAFHDIVDGDNAVNLKSANNTIVMLHGYKAAPGWDATTGLGTPIVSNLVPLMAQLAVTHQTAP
ncbi:S53 family peptidase [Dictyobacter formicarum]|uniref:Serine protease n=1 Tax=Dictyobacter formicarum TaxID=2778368 RepID=A0ABQ3VLL4_9CHLR|nr:S53 family peptidase [Dictyobacter formicarum]GHO86571.1 serine protease [Dictyobacter formicarum]